MIFIKLKNWKNKITFKTATEDLQAAHGKQIDHETSKLCLQQFSSMISVKNEKFLNIKLIDQT